jgi:hypothetical protein
MVTGFQSSESGCVHGIQLRRLGISLTFAIGCAQGIQDGPLGCPRDLDTGSIDGKQAGSLVH